MPVYERRCLKCEEVFEYSCSMGERNDPRPCANCGAEETEKIMSLGNFILKGDGWPGKNMRVSSQMATRRKKLGSKKREMKGDGEVPSLLPNVDGERTDTWSEATRLAASKGKDTTGYENYSKQETHKKKGIISTD